LKRFPPYSGTRLSTRTTRAPAPTKRCARTEPIKPRPPVMRTFLPAKCWCESMLFHIPIRVIVRAAISDGQLIGRRNCSGKGTERCGSHRALRSNGLRSRASSHSRCGIPISPDSVELLFETLRLHQSDISAGESSGTVEVESLRNHDKDSN